VTRTQGDVRAQAILAEAGQELALAAKAVIRKLEMATGVRLDNRMLARLEEGLRDKPLALTNL